MKNFLSFLIIISLISYPFQVQAVTAQYCYDGTNTWASWWMEDLTDNTSNGYTLTNNSSATFVAANFDNGGRVTSGSWFDYSASALGWAGGNISISVWIKMVTDSGTQELFQISDSVTTKTALTMRYDGSSWILYRYRINEAVISVTETVALGTTNWHHFVVTYNTAGSGTLTVYRNNVSKGTASGAGVGSGTPTASHFALGKGTAPEICPANYASAIYDEVIVENTVWDATKVDAVYDRTDAAIKTSCAAVTAVPIISPLINFE